MSYGVGGDDEGLALLFPLTQAWGAQSRRDWAVSTANAPCRFFFESWLYQGPALLFNIYLSVPSVIDPRLSHHLHHFKLPIHIYTQVVFNYRNRTRHSYYNHGCQRYVIVASFHPYLELCSFLDPNPNPLTLQRSLTTFQELTVHLPAIPPPQRRSSPKTRSLSNAIMVPPPRLRRLLPLHYHCPAQLYHHSHTFLTRLQTPTMVTKSVISPATMTWPSRRLRQETKTAA